MLMVLPIVIFSLENVVAMVCVNQAEYHALLPLVVAAWILIVVLEKDAVIMPVNQVEYHVFLHLAEPAFQEAVAVLVAVVQYLL